MVFLGLYIRSMTFTQGFEIPSRLIETNRPD